MDTFKDSIKAKYVALKVYLIAGLMEYRKIPEEYKLRLFIFFI